MNILAQICQHQHELLSRCRRQQPVERLREQPAFYRSCYSMKAALLDLRASGIIAEFKRQSPSRGPINPLADVVEIATGYERAGATALSILTNARYFGAQPNDFALARSSTQRPLLRKDFIVDAYQIVESKAMGADVILLIAGILSPAQVDEFTALAHELGMEVLLETHGPAEVEAYRHCRADMVGINNRDLKTFRTDLSVSLQLAAALPPGCLAVAESGISSVASIQQLRLHGFKGFLIGEWLMRQPQPARFCAELIEQLGYEN
jgi:indole-3-glycerol phosphate synthase